MKLTIAFLLTLSALSAQQVVNVSVTVDNGTIAAVNTWRLQQVTAQSTLNGAINNSATSITLAAPGVAKNGDRLLIESEELTITSAVSAPTYTVTRGAGITFAAAHADKTAVSVLKYPTLLAIARQDLIDTIQRILEQVPNAVIATELAKRATSDAAIQAAKTAAVQ